MAYPADTLSHAARRRPGASWAKLWRYAGGSVIAAGCSEVTLVVLYGLFGVSPGWAASLAWLAGALPNYWLNRSWTWQRRGRPSLTREVLPYAAVIAVTLLLATVSTRAVDEALRASGTAEGTRVALVAVTFLGVYVAMFVLRFALLDRLFTTSTTPAAPAAHPAAQPGTPPEVPSPGTDDSEGAR